MRHHSVGGRALGGVDGLGPTGTDVAIGEPAHVEPLQLPVLLALDQHGAAYGVQFDHGGGMTVETLGGIVVAGELDALPGAKLLFHFDERLGLIPA